ncbi:MAG: Na/Pi symporter [Planctomycetota bacterium]
MSSETRPEPESGRHLHLALRLGVVLLFLFGFLVAIQIMGGSIKLMGKGTAQGLFEGVRNPFAGLSVGVLATVLVQSSSATTSLIVSMVGSGGATALPIASAVPMVMGANIGTTITNTIVSIGHIRRGAEFHRAFAAATVHDFFNLMCVAVMLPAELLTGFLSKSAGWTSAKLYGGAKGGELHSPIKAAVKGAAQWAEDSLRWVGLEGTPLALVYLLLGLALTFTCLIFITKTMRVLISSSLERTLNRSLGRSGLIGIVVGMTITVAVQSSSITTSLLVPLCAAGVLTLENAFPIMLGANIGTTVTALLASLAADQAGLTIALVHTFFNLSGVLLFYPVPALRALPLRAARALATRAQRNPLWLVGYVLGMFIVMPLLGWAMFHLWGSST